MPISAKLDALHVPAAALAGVQFLLTQNCRHIANARKDMNSDVAALYIDSLNEVNGIHATRVAIAMQARVPGEIWIVLYCITILGMVSVGYQTGIAGSKRSVTWPILALSFALVFALIASLDRPDSGILKVTQQPLINLRDAMDTAASG